MKKIVLLSMAVLTLSACSATNTNTANLPKVGIANPASEYCVKQGGKVEIKNDKNGQVGYCHLKNGTAVEEWAFFRANQQTRCLPEEAQKLVGQSGLTAAQIKQLTHSEIVRIVAPNQPVTMDYLDNRVTVMIDPVTHKISQASCG
ncbi:hypothetical protein F941_01701 [Acinetobacter bouvetii DSM 14964 = CIP 107468]|jgi:putative hemolysin|uniref:Hemolysin n=1 Tax=Acinetobacter bouvetii DSM 14964 = CIP 107468 TaxID=1120925 RepID=N9DQG3_9GAMM|nr:I78 family peptidase inhibitor [Acinetobacter bouvetii]ENV82935.1 hypothetical protein F941_01701 [Acinetobacter bouvetii DSM 14964 = CIP 107468]BCU64680.1 hemolysin [Acinetobacter bouvetii]